MIFPQYGWFVEPIIFGNYPQILIDRVSNFSLAEGFEKSRLPEFTNEEIQIMNGTFDFMGLNFYSSSLVTLADPDAGESPSHWRDVGVQSYQDPSWPSSASGWLKVTPWGLYKMLVYIKEEYNNPPIIITENGFSDHGQLDDYDRANFYKQYLYELLRAVTEESCNVFGFTAWSLLDNFEWTRGYTY